MHYDFARCPQQFTPPRGSGKTSGSVYGQPISSATRHSNTHLSAPRARRGLKLVWLLYQMDAYFTSYIHAFEELATF